MRRLRYGSKKFQEDYRTQEGGDMKKIQNNLNSTRRKLSTHYRLCRFFRNHDFAEKSSIPTSVSGLTTLRSGFTLLEILIAVMILAVGILTVSQMTILGLRTNRVIRDRSKAREVLAEGMEVLKILDAEDPLLIANKDTLTLDDTTGAYRADTTNIVGRTITHVGYDVYWNIVDNHPNPGLKTIRMFVFRQNKRLIHADYVRWR